MTAGYRSGERLDLSKLLNPEQFIAATTTEGPLLILAGAGSGKTRVLVHRIAHILAIGLARPWEIMAVTFTNKAAGEMRDRLTRLLGESVRDAWIGTFHALSARILRIEGHRLGYTRGFTIYDDDDSKRLVKSIMEELGIETAGRGVSPNAVANQIDRAKNHGRMPDEFLKQRSSEDQAERIARRVYPKYQDALRRSNAMDFGDLLLLAVELFRHHPEARDKFRDKIRYVMVDEFQDTNSVQYELLRLLSEPRRNLAVVGDDDQAIYRWRGADVTNILGFEKQYPEAVVVKLERNYRSTANILTAANAIIRRNKLRHDKTLKTDAPPGAKVGVGLTKTSEAEALVIARIVAERIRDGERPEDFAILYRQNAQSRLFEESFRRVRVPYVLIGGTGFYERMEVKDILAYLRVTANPTSRQDFERIVNTPARGIGDKTFEALRRAGAALGLEGAMLLETPPEALLAAGLKPAAIEKLRALGKLLAALRTLAAQASATEVARAIIEGVEYKEHLERTEPHTADDRFQNVSELVSSIAEHEAMLQAEADQAVDPARGGRDPDGRGPDQGPSFGLAGAATPLQAFLDSTALVSTNDQPSETGSVSLLTLHSAKGLEFKTVFMVGMEEMTFPSRQALEGSSDAIEEERRLCYVGMTRAMQELNLVAARYRRIYGREEPRWPSRFLAELPDAIAGNLGGSLGALTALGATAGGDGLDDRRRHWGSAAYPDAPGGRASGERRIERGADQIVYDTDAATDMEEVAPHAWDSRDAEPDDDFGPRRRSPRVSEAAGGEAFRLGSRVFHSTFGEGTVEDLDGHGPAARLTIRFPSAGVKRVIARFVRSLEES